jgi:hypothetical protein
MISTIAKTDTMQLFPARKLERYSAVAPDYLEIFAMEFSESAAFAPTSAGCLEPSHGPLANEIAFGQRVEKLDLKSE